MKRNLGGCTVLECHGENWCKGLCKRHYQRKWSAGSVHAGDFTFDFCAKIEVTESCWIWRGALFASGYGKVSCGEKKRRAHRVAHELFIGPLPDDLHVLHRCDNPPCVNPTHLFLGTHIDNMRDMEAKGRAKWIQENLRAKRAA